jgi:hypothetical protein
MLLHNQNVVGQDKTNFRINRLSHNCSAKVAIHARIRLNSTLCNDSTCLAVDDNDPGGTLSNLCNFKDIVTHRNDFFIDDNDPGGTLSNLCNFKDRNDFFCPAT